MELYPWLKRKRRLGYFILNRTIQSLKAKATDISVVLSLTIKGAKNDEAVLCTSSTTYAIKYVSTSNTVLLIPPQQTAPQSENMDSSAGGKDCIKQANASVVATASGLIELVETAPRLDKLKNLLNQRPYTEDLDEEQVFYMAESSFS